MELLLHYVWQQRLLPPTPLSTDSGEAVDVIDPGLHNTNAGPDFFNAKIKIGDTLWVGNVEIHERSSDWFHHHHDADAAYDNVILHVVHTVDAQAVTSNGRQVPQIEIAVPEYVERNFAELRTEASYPPCWRVIPSLPIFEVHGFLNVLTTERIESKCAAVEAILERTAGDWSQACFAVLARSFGFGINADAFEEWARGLPLQAARKHCDDLFQLEALFLGQAGLLEEGAVREERRDDHYKRLASEYRFLRHKFDLTPMPATHWRFLRLRPQNFPHVRLSQLAQLFYDKKTDLSRLLEAQTIEDLQRLLSTHATPYWQTHYSFGLPSSEHTKALRPESINILIINAIVPLFFTYGRQHFDDDRCELAMGLLESLKPEKNNVVRQWAKVGIEAQNAADSQALLTLRHNYCDKKDCLRCRFGTYYMKKAAPRD